MYVSALLLWSFLFFFLRDQRVSMGIDLHGLPIQKAYLSKSTCDMMVGSEGVYCIFGRRLFFIMATLGVFCGQSSRFVPCENTLAIVLKKRKKMNVKVDARKAVCYASILLNGACANVNVAFRRN